MKTLHAGSLRLDDSNAENPNASALRRDILRTLTREGAQFSKAAMKLAPDERVPARRRLKLVWDYIRPSLAFVTGVVLALTVVGGVLMFERRSRQANAANDSRFAATGSPVLDGPISQRNDDQPSESPSDALSRQARLQAAMAEAKARIDRLARERTELLSSAGQLKEAEVAAEQRITDLEQRLTLASASEARVQAELSALREAHATVAANLAAKERNVRELNAKLEEQSAVVERETELLSAGREIRDVVAARNLHIIDVYDTDGRGKTKTAFGRVFYTEGKSLLFYAYDLPAHRIENAKFYAWGKRDGSTQDVRSLGLMYNDDQTQKRWVLNITDPRILTQIDSVFITLERMDKPGDRPTGKEILSAYLHSPANHP